MVEKQEEHEAQLGAETLGGVAGCKGSLSGGTTEDCSTLASARSRDNEDHCLLPTNKI